MYICKKMFIKTVKPLHIVHNGLRRKSTYQPIGEFYSGRAVLITGGTGFVGKDYFHLTLLKIPEKIYLMVLLEKLLYHCNGIEKVYLVIRDNEKMKSSDRLHTMLKLPLFQRLREEHPDLLNKIIPISGDITNKDLGINRRDADAIKNEVSVVFHSAASVKFKDTLMNLVYQNTTGTQNIVDFSTKIKNLQVFVHVSSAYSQSDNKLIEEKIYPPAITLDEVNKVAAGQNQDEEDAILNGKPNTYTLTKALAEDIVVESHQKNNLPAIIIRPSIISPMYKDCLPGWIDNWFGATTLITTTGKGLCHVIRGQGTNIIDLIPVDYVASTMIVAAAKYRRESKTVPVPVYNVCSSSMNPITLNDLRKILLTRGPQLKFNVLPIGVVITDSKYLFHMTRILSEAVPSFAIDLLENLRNRKPWYNQVLQMLKEQRKVMNPFISNSWIVKSSHTEYLALSLSPEDSRRYQLHAQDIDWDEYMSLYLKGVNKYMLKKRETH